MRQSALKIYINHDKIHRISYSPFILNLATTHVVPPIMHYQSWQFDLALEELMWSAYFMAICPVEYYRWWPGDILGKYNGNLIVSCQDRLLLTKALVIGRWSMGVGCWGLGRNFTKKKQQKTFSIPQDFRDIFWLISVLKSTHAITKMILVVHYNSFIQIANVEILCYTKITLNCVAYMI